jgi:hypothetical protein
MIQRILSNQVQPTPTIVEQPKERIEREVVVVEEEKSPVNEPSPLKEENDLVRDIIDRAAISIAQFIQVVFYLQLVRFLDWPTDLRSIDVYWPRPRDLQSCERERERSTDQ